MCVQYVDVVSVLFGGLCDLCFCVDDCGQHKIKKHRKFDLAEGYSTSRREKTMSLFLIFKINRVLETIHDQRLFIIYLQQHCFKVLTYTGIIYK